MFFKYLFLFLLFLCVKHTYIKVWIIKYKHKSQTSELYQKCSENNLSVTETMNTEKIKNNADTTWVYYIRH